MVNKYCVFFGIAVAGISLYPANPLSPGTPVPIITNGTAYMPIVVTGTDAGFMTVAVAADSLQANFSTDDGATWSSPAPVAENAFFPMWVSGTAAGYVATWIGYDIGYQTAAPLWSFSSDAGNTWSTRAAIVAGALSTSVYSPIVVNGTTAGFMAVWRDHADNNAYAAFTSNDIGAWESPINISNSGTVNSAVIVNGTDAGFMATWQDASNNAYSSFSADHVSWSSPSQIVNTNTVNSDVWVAGNSTGFMATWQDNANNGYASFSSDNGTAWSTPILITDDVCGAPVDVSVTGVTSGFVAAWIASDSNAYASFSSGGTSAWSTPVQITDTDDVSDGSVEDAGSGHGFVSVTAVGDDCMFAWLDDAGNTNASFSRVTTTPAINPPTNVQGLAQQNVFLLQTDLVNLVTWDAPTTGTAPVSYAIYRDYALTDLITTVSADQTLEYYDHNRAPSTIYGYYIVSVDEAGDVSEPNGVLILS